MVAVTGPFPPWRGGIAQFTLRLSQAISRQRGIRRVSFSRLYPGLLFPGTAQTEPGGGGHSADAFVDSCNPLAWPRTRHRVASLGADLAVVQWWHPFFAPSLSASLPPRRALPRVAVCHNVEPHESFPLAGLLSRSFLRSCDILAVHSAGDEEKARGLFPGARVVRLFHPLYDQYLAHDPGREAARGMLGVPPGRRVVLFFGLVRPYKGLPDLLEAFSGLDGDVELIVAGECYSGGPRLRARLREPDLEGRVRWIDRFVDDREVAILFSASDLVALPYRDASQSGVAQIALAFGRPLVLTRTGGLPELVQDGVTGRLCPPGDPPALREALSQVISMLDRPGLGAEIAAFAERFSWDRYASLLLEAAG